MPSHVFRPGSLGPLTLPHRIIMGAMHLNLETRPDGGATMAAFYAERARGGAALIITGGCAVSPEGAGGRHYARTDDPAQHPSLAAWTTAVHRHGGKIALQLFHAGRYTTREATGHAPVAPSATPGRFGAPAPSALNEEQIQAVINRFADGAAIARTLGFDAVEIMAAQGYLLNQFLSPLTNHRDDHWGGDAARRRHFPLAVLSQVRQAVGEDFTILVRMSGNDLMPGSSLPDEVDDLATALARGGADALHVSVGWHESRTPTVQTLVPPGAWISHTAGIRRKLRACGLQTPVITSTRINRIDLAERILAEQHADFVAMARPFLADPDIVRKARQPTKRPTNICIACNTACIDRSLGDTAVSCLVNPRAGRELEIPSARPPRARGRPPARFTVIGGGLSGLEGARVLASAGHRVDLYEATGALGGQFNLARLVPGKADFGATIDYFQAELQRLHVRVHLNHPVRTANLVLGPLTNGILLATGVHPRRTDIPGDDLEHVVTYQNALQHPDEFGPRTVVIGAGGIAVDVAHLLITLGHDVTLLGRNGRIGESLGRSTRWAVLAELRRHGVRWHTEVACTAVLRHGVRLSDRHGHEFLLPADTVVLAVGQTPNNTLLPELEEAGILHRAAGGAAGTHGLNAVRAVEQGMLAAHDLLKAVTKGTG
ncbi:FAD-dependent oxidoreductase [Streptomyces sp. G-G2]|uniref:oxidoreductase n=1 Tax=Streptomyces sp. G-G2 TaxID=3046201 RepID=UPI0024B920D0|nr:FAD-dependent oxidoreductase [Streptomyces sp. G-G2]MDJ0385952.1 FAD-dependent oxidoreductase [Streptomyces sp. G-G2]